VSFGLARENRENTMKKMLLAGVLALTTLLPITAFAQVAGYNVIAIHGFGMEDYTVNPSYEEIVDAGKKHWDSPDQFWSDHYEAHMSWGSQHRIENEEGGLGQIMKDVYKQAEEISASHLCDAGCVIVSNSTGDLVTRYFLDTQNDVMKNPLNIVATLDFVGAGGGTELADLAVSAVNNQEEEISSWLLTFIAGSVTGGTPTPENIGVLYDLQPTVARTLGTNFNNAVPRLRFSSDNGNGDIQGIYMLGNNDGVVPAHSSCGSVRNEAIDSCSDVLSYDGEMDDTRGPYALMNNHFPIIMAYGLEHLEVNKKVAPEQDMTYVNSFAWFNDKIKTHVDEGFWWWSSDYLYITGSADKSVPQVLFESVQ